MEVMDIVDQTQDDILNIVAGILHLGNIAFAEDGNYAIPEDDGCELVHDVRRICQTTITVLLSQSCVYKYSTIESVDSICRNSTDVIESVDSMCRIARTRNIIMLMQNDFSKSPKQLTYKPL